MTETPQELIVRLRGRAKFCSDRGEIKSPSAMNEAADALEASLAREVVLRDALATARDALAQYACRCMGPMPDCAQGGVADCGWTARSALALIPATPPALS